MFEKNQLGFVMVFLVVVSGAAGYARYLGARPSDIALIGFVAFGAIILAFAAAVLWHIANSDTALKGIISESDDVIHDGAAKASLSRFQFLIFTFVIAGLFLMLSIETGGFVDIPQNVLLLLGISGGSFLVSKSVGKGQKDKKTQTTEPDPKVGKDKTGQ